LPDHRTGKPSENWGRKVMGLKLASLAKTARLPKSVVNLIIGAVLLCRTTPILFSFISYGWLEL
jgi:hypothetical protein